MAWKPYDGPRRSSRIASNRAQRSGEDVAQVTITPIGDSSSGDISEDSVSEAEEDAYRAGSQESTDGSATYQGGQAQETSVAVGAEVIHDPAALSDSGRRVSAAIPAREGAEVGHQTGEVAGVTATTGVGQVEVNQPQPANKPPAAMPAINPAYSSLFPPDPQLSNSMPSLEPATSAHASPPPVSSRPILPENPDPPPPAHTPPDPFAPVPNAPLPHQPHSLMHIRVEAS